MSPDLERLIGRAVADKTFRDQLLNDPDGAIRGSGLSLSPDEVDQVKQGIDKLKAQLSPQQIGEQFSVGLLGAWA
jgi:hypothetical protein